MTDDELEHMRRAQGLLASVAQLREYEIYRAWVRKLRAERDAQEARVGAEKARLRAEQARIEAERAALQQREAEEQLRIQKQREQEERRVQKQRIQEQIDQALAACEAARRAARLARAPQRKVRSQPPPLVLDPLNVELARGQRREALLTALDGESRFLEQRNQAAHRRLLRVLDRICPPEPPEEWWEEVEVFGRKHWH
jgi:hypothetical protein